MVAQKYCLQHYNAIFFLWVWFVWVRGERPVWGMREGRAVTPLMIQKNCLRRCSLRHCNISLEGTQFLVKGKIPSTVRYLLQNEFLYFMEYSRIFETPSTPPSAILHCWESPPLSPVSSGIAWTALEICASPIPTGSPWRQITDLNSHHPVAIRSYCNSVTFLSG